MYALKSDAIIVVLTICIDDWQCDQLRWSNQCVQKLPKKDRTIKKS